MPSFPPFVPPGRSRWILLLLAAAVSGWPMFSMAQPDPYDFDAAGNGRILRGNATKTQNAPGPVWEEAPGTLKRKPYFPKSPALAKGNRLVEAYQLDAAEAHFLKMLEKNPADAAAHNGLGMIYYERTTSSNQTIRDSVKSRYQDAITEFVTALRYQPNYVEARLNLGTIYAETGRLRDAEEEFQRAYALAPKNSEANEKMGMILYKQGKVNDALPFLEEAVRRKTNNSSAYYTLSQIYTDRGQYDEALKALQTALYQYPNSAPVHHQLGVVYEAQGNGAAAVTEYQKAIWIKPEYVPAHIRLAEHYQKRGDTGAALTVMKNLLEAYPPDKYPAFESLKFRTAEMSLKNNQPEVAARIYREILAENPNDAQAKNGLSQCEFKLAQQSAQEGNLVGAAQAQEQLRATLRLDPDNLKARLAQLQLAGGPRPLSDFNAGFADAVLREPAVYGGDSLSKGEILIANHRLNQAEREFETVLHTFTAPSDTTTLGEIFLKLGSPTMAERSFEKTLAAQPGDAAATQGMREVRKAQRKSRGLVLDAQVMSKNKSYVRAISLLDEALDYDQYNADAYWFLGQNYERVERYDLAIDQYKTYLQLAPVGDQSEEARKRIQKLLEKAEK